MSLKVGWVDGGREATQPPNPQYPDGRDIDISEGAVMSCSRLLPYPAPRCGTWVVTCTSCDYTIAITAAGRIDDPCSIKVACKARARC